MTEKEIIIATKQDIKILYRKIKLNLENKLEEKKVEIEKTLEDKLELKKLEIEKTIRIEIEKIRSEFQLEIEKLRAEIEIKLQAMKNSLLKWIIGLILAQTLTILMAVALK